MEWQKAKVTKKEERYTTKNKKIYTKQEQMQSIQVTISKLQNTAKLQSSQWPREIVSDML